MIKKVLSFILALLIIFLTTILIGCDKTISSGDFTYELVDGKAEITGYTGKEIEINVPDSIDGHTVTSIGDKAFNEQVKIEKITLPSTIKQIGKSSFFSCTRLKSINLPEGLSIIGNCAFFDCESLESIEVPSSVTKLGDYVFGKCYSLTSVILNEGNYDTIPLECFYYCNKLKSIKIPDCIKKIENKAFTSCYELSDIQFPKELDYIGSYAFNFVFEGEGVPPQPPQREMFDAVVKEIRDYAFFDSQFKKINLNGTQKIGKGAFARVALEEINIPKTVEDLSPGFLIQCYEVKKINVEKENENYEVIDGVLYLKSTDDKKILLAIPAAYSPEEAYTIPEYVNAIEDYAFTNFRTTKTLSVPKTVKSIGKAVFSRCEIDTLDFSPNIDCIEDEMFYTSNISNLKIDDDIQKIGARVFSVCACSNIILPKHLSEISRDAFSLAHSSVNVTISNDADNYIVVNKSLYTKDKKELIFVSGKYEEEKDSYTLESETEVIRSNAFSALMLKTVIFNEGLKEIEDNAVLFRNVSNLKPMTIPSSVTKIGKNNFAYECLEDNSQYEITSTSIDHLTSFELYGEIGSEAERYAIDEHMAFFTSEPSQNIKEVSLQKDETVDFTISNLASIKPLYFSSNKDIATIDSNGTIKGIAKGKTYIVAAVNCKYFVCEVNVTSGTYVNTDPYKNYKVYDYSTINNYTKSYYKSNGYAEDGSDFDKKDFSSVSHYTSSDYHVYVAILSNDVDTEYIRSHYQGDIEPYYTYVENLPIELKRLKTDSDVVAYSGASSASQFTGSDSSLQSLIDSIGKTIKEPNVTSTSLVHGICSGFGGGLDRLVTQFYIPKSSNVGGYIAAISLNPQEYEYFLPQNIEVKIVDAGVRAVEIEKLEGGKKLEVERYLSMEIVG